MRWPACSRDVSAADAIGVIGLSFLGECAARLVWRRRGSFSRKALGSPSAGTLGAGANGHVRPNSLQLLAATGLASKETAKISDLWAKGELSSYQDAKHARKYRR